MLRGTPTTSTTATTTTAEHVLDSTSSYHASNNNNTLAAPEKASIMMGDASASSSYCRSHDGSSVNCGCDSCDCQSCSVKYVEVTCPASLCEGFRFWVTLDDTSFQVTVPVGGVKEGQILRVPRGDISTLCCSRKKTATTTTTSTSGNDGKGRWKGGIFSWYKLGLCHPVVCNAMICPQVLLSQLLTRMNMTLLVAPTTTTNNTDSNSTATTTSNSKMSNSFRKTFRTIMGCLILLALYDALMAPPLFMVDLNEESGELIITSTAFRDIGGGSYSKVLWHQFFYILMSLPMSIYGIFVVMKLRAAVRAKYGIPTGILGSAEDFCYVFWCNCCVLTQLARQTADYDIEQPSCCSSNGLLKAPSPNKKDKGSTSISSSFPSLSPLSSSKVKLSSQNLQQRQQSPSSPSSSPSSSSSTLLV